MKRKIVALWVISCLTVSSAKAQFNTVSDNVCRYKIRKVEEKSSFSANSSVDSIMKNQPQQKTDSVDNKQEQWISSNTSITYPLKSIKVTSPYGYRHDPFTGKLSWHNGLDLRAKNEPTYAMMDGIVEKVGYDNRSALSADLLILKASSTSSAVTHSVMLWMSTAVPKNSSICRLL